MNLRKCLLSALAAAMIPGAVAIAIAAKGPDRAKNDIESRAKTILARTAKRVADQTSNPTVKPGLVHWHKDLAEAQAAARKSHKPVLLFQMMGRLDQEFC